LSIWSIKPLSKHLEWEAKYFKEQRRSLINVLRYGGSKDFDMPSIDLLETNEELVALVALPGTTRI